jgi:hypothetical protein
MAVSHSRIHRKSGSSSTILSMTTGDAGIIDKRQCNAARCVIWANALWQAYADRCSDAFARSNIRGYPR